MAMAKVRKIDGNPNTFLKCHFCANSFTLKERRPLILDCCLYTICTACARNITVHHNGQYECPVCRRQQKIETSCIGSEASGDSGQQVPGHTPVKTKDEDRASVNLSVELVRDKLIEYKTIDKSDIITCFSCPVKTPSTWRCENCAVFMCDQCQVNHKTDIKTKRHLVISLDTLKARPLKNFRQNHFCSKHLFSRLTLYCSTCRAVICNSCTRDGHPRASHSILTIQEAFGTRIRLTSKLLKKTNQKSKTLSVLSDKLKQKNESLGLSTTEAADAIENAFSGLIEKIQRRKSELLSELDRKRSLESSGSGQDADSTVAQLSLISTATEYAKEVRSKADTVEFLQLYPAVSDVLRSIAELPDEDIKYSRKGVVFQPTSLEWLERLVQNAGVLQMVTFKSTASPNREEISFDPATPFRERRLDAVVTLPCDVTSPEEYLIDLRCSSEDKVIILQPSVTGQTITVTCFRITFDLTTIHSERAVSADGVMANHPPVEAHQENGCRLKAYPGSLSNRPLSGRGKYVWITRAVASLKQKVPDNKMVFEAALTETPVDARFSQRMGTSVVLAGCDLHQELCLKIKYDGRSVAHVPTSKNRASEKGQYDLGFLLDLDSNKLHMLNLATHTLLCTIDDIRSSKPLWPIFCVGRPSYADIKLKVVDLNKQKTTYKFTQLLIKSLRDQAESSLRIDAVADKQSNSEADRIPCDQAKNNLPSHPVADSTKLMT